MDYLTTILIALGLSMDTFAVSIVSGSVYKQTPFKVAFLLATSFGFFQAVMPVVGFVAATSIKGYIEGWDHWAAFSILAAVGLKMIYESYTINPARQRKNPMKLSVLLVLSLATSIDALAVGVTLSFIKILLITAVLIIGLTTFIVSFCGVFVGKVFGHFFESKVEAAGGLILIAIGAKILVQHIF